MTPPPKIISHRKRHPRGLSLVELLMILTLMGIIGSISTSALFSLRNSTQVKNGVKTMAGLFQEARSKSRHSAIITVGNEECSMQAYRVTIEDTNPPTQFKLYGIPRADCNISADQLFKERTLSQAVILEKTPTNLGRIQYEVPSGQVTFFSSSGTLLTNSEITLNFSAPDGTLDRIITIDAIRGYPELNSL